MHEMVDMKDVGDHQVTLYDATSPPCDGHSSDNPILPLNQEDEVLHASMHEAMIEKAQCWVVQVLWVVGIAEKEANAHKGVVK